MTTKERAELRRHLAEQRPDKSLGCTDAFWLTAADLIALLDQADAEDRRVAELEATLAKRTAALKQIAEWDMMSPDCWTMTNGSDFPFFRKLVLDALSDAAGAYLADIERETAEVLADPDAMAAIEASKYTPDEDLISHEEVKRQLGVDDSHPPLTRERVAAAVGELFHCDCAGKQAERMALIVDGRDMGGWGEVPMVNYLCRLLGVPEGE